MISNKKGFTLIQVMVAIGLASVLMLILMKTSELMLDIKKNNDQNLEIASIIHKIGIVLNKEPICTVYNLNQTKFNPKGKIGLQNIKLNSTTQIVSSNSQFSKTLKVSKISIENFQVTQANAAYTDYLADLNIFISRESGMGSKNIVRKIPLNIIAEKLGPNLAKVVKCRANDPLEDANMFANNSIGSFESSVCELFNGTFNSQTKRCDGVNIASNNTSAPSSNSPPKKCGQCLKGGGYNIDIKCQGVSLCSTIATCPANFNLVSLKGNSTSTGVGTEKYCESSI